MSNGTQKYTTFYITKEIALSLDQISSITDIPKTRIINRALRDFIGRRPQRIQPELLVTKKTDPRYIKRDYYMGCHMDPGIHAEVKRIAQEQHCTMAAVIMQALGDWETAMRYRGGQ